MPRDTFRMLIYGGSGSGKSNPLYHILMKPLVYYDQIHLYGKNLEQDKHQNMMNQINEISEAVGCDVLVCSNDEIIPIENLMENETQKVTIFDYFICEKNQKPLIDYFIRGRHRNCSVIYLSQSFYKTPKDIRLNCSHFCVYDFPNSQERSLISRELGIGKDQYIKATQKPYSFLHVDKPMKKVKKNFYGNI